MITFCPRLTVISFTVPSLIGAEMRSSRTRSLVFQTLEQRRVFASLPLAPSFEYSLASQSELVGEAEPDNPRYVGDDHDPFLPNFGHPDVIGSRRVLTSQRNGSWQEQFGSTTKDDVIIILHDVVLDSIADSHTVVVGSQGVLEFFSYPQLEP